MTSATGGPGSSPAPPAAGSGGPPATARAVGRAGRLGLAASCLSVALTLLVAAAGPSVMEPALPGRPGQPPWAASLHLSPYVAITLTAVALVAGAAGLGLCLHAGRRGWCVSPRALLVAGLLAAAALALVPPFGSSDHLSYAAYGRMAVTGHDPYTTTPAALARLGDPVAGAVQDWRHSPSVYGSLATGAQALASLAGGTSVRLTVFVLSALGAVAFAVTGLLLYRLAGGRRDRQLRAVLLWAFNPLLLQVLVAGAHADGLAVVFGVAAVTLLCFALPNGAPGSSTARAAGVAGLAGISAGLALAVKVSLALVVPGLTVAAVLAWRARQDAAPGGAPPGGGAGGPSRRRLAAAVLGLAGGFAVTAAASLVPWGLHALGPALRAGSFASLASPWRGVRAGLSLLTGEPSAGTVVKAGAVVLAVAVLMLFVPHLTALASGAACGLAALAGASVFAVVFAWLVAWPYVLPWYDSLAWAMLAATPWLPPPWPVLQWLLLARTTILGLAYLPARGITMPGGLAWLRSVVRTDLAPVALFAVLVVLIAALWPRRHPTSGPGTVR
jgi:alpha-1,6-mannosyltransferase